ncbi:MAG: hypothetical protein JO046_12870 [Solirubrobacterales bacterium]|nr:hypothetical protein [Solirubrobacterales bacterium]
MVFRRALATLVASIVAVGCGGAGAHMPVVAHTPAAARSAAFAHWTGYVRANGPIDVVGPRSDGVMVVAAGGRLRLLSPSGRLRAFAPTYHSNPGLEAYIALPRAGHRGCSFGGDTVFAISFGSPRGVVAISSQGRVRPFATVRAPGLIDGIAFDETGRFGYRLLVATTAGPQTTVDAIDCHGAVRRITAKAHRVEGGIAVAPASFGRFAGDLIMPDELGGGIYAVTPRGGNLLVAHSDLPHGGDTGVESEAFLPARGGYDAVLADRLTPRNPHPGDNVLLRLTSAELAAAGARPGDLLVASEGGAKTDAVHCSVRGCGVRHVADGPVIAHGEGHIAIMPR